MVHVHVDLKFQSAPHSGRTIGTSKIFIVELSDILHVQRFFRSALPQRMNSIAILSIVWHHGSPNSNSMVSRLT